MEITALVDAMKSLEAAGLPPWVILFVVYGEVFKRQLRSLRETVNSHITSTEERFRALESQAHRAGEIGDYQSVRGHYESENGRKK